MSSKYGFESTEQKRRRLEQEANERARGERENSARLAATYRQTDAQVRDVLADYAAVNGLEVDGMSVKSKGGSTAFRVNVSSESIVVTAEDAGSSVVEQVADVLHKVTGKHTRTEGIPNYYWHGGFTGNNL